MSGPADPVLAPEDLSVEAAAETAPVLRRPRRRSLRELPRLVGRMGTGVIAVGTKEMRGRMRGRRAFVIVTIYLLLLAAFAWMYQQILAAEITTSFGAVNNFASALVGQRLFGGLLILMTLLVVFLAPSFTAGAISLEREKQTLDMLLATPITSVSVVVGKLLSALVYVFILVAASLPVTAIVFLYGGVAPVDVLRGYIVLFVTAIGLGAFGIFCSSLLKRTQAATVVATFGVLSVTLGSIFVLHFWSVMAGLPGQGPTRGVGPINGPPPLIVAYLNPVLAQADIACSTQVSLDTWCSRYLTLIDDGTGIIFTDVPTDGGGSEPVPVFRKEALPAIGPNIVGIDQGLGAGPAVQDIAPFGAARASLWESVVATWLALSAIFLAISIQLVSPTRRWRPSLRRRPKGISA